VIYIYLYGYEADSTGRITKNENVSIIHPEYLRTEDEWRSLQIAKKTQVFNFVASEGYVEV